MAILNFKMGEYKNLPATKVAGTVYVTTDEQAMYVDISNSKRIRMNQIISYETFSDFTAALSKAVPPYDTQAFYYIVKDNALLKYNVTYGSEYDPDGDGNGVAAAGKWVQINSAAQIEGALASITSRVSNLETWKADTIEPWMTTVNTDLFELSEADIALNNRINDEIARATAAEEKIAKFDGNALVGGALKTEVDRAKAAEEAIAKFDDSGNITSGALKTEVDRAIDAEKALGLRIDNVVGDLANEVIRATNAEGKIATFDNSDNLTGGALYAEQQARTQAITDVQNTHNNFVNNEYTTFKTTATNDINALKDWKPGIDDSIESINGDIETLKLRDTALQNAITDETNRATAAEEKIAKFDGNALAGGALKTEVDRAKAAEERIAIFDASGNITSGALKVEIDRATQAETNLTNNINAISGDLANEVKRATAAEEKIAKFDGDTLTDGALKNVYDDMIKRLQAADAMKYQGAINDTSKLPAVNNVEKGWTYKVTAKIASDAISGVTINWHNTNDKVLRIGDLLIANGTENTANTGTTAGKITSNLSWDHIPSGYVADYNPRLAADSGNSLPNTNAGGTRTTAAITLTKGDDTVDTINFVTLDDNTSLKVSGDNNTIQFSLEWGSF